MFDLPSGYHVSFFPPPFSGYTHDRLKLEDALRKQSIVGAIDVATRLLIESICYLAIPLRQRIAATNAAEEGKSNSFGDIQIVADRSADDLIRACLRKDSNVRGFASEENPSLEWTTHIDGKVVLFDPLDGSKGVKSNFACASLFSIFDGPIQGRKLRDQSAAILITFGLRTEITITTGQSRGAWRFVLDERDGTFYLSKQIGQIRDEADVISPGDLFTFASTRPKLIERWAKERKTLRYTGCLGLDANLILEDESGLFFYLGSREHKQGKLRLIFECGPIAMLVNEAGGTATNGVKPILDMRINGTDQRSQMIVGSQNAVAQIERELGEEEFQDGLLEGVVK